MNRELLVEIGPFKELDSIAGVQGNGNGIRFISNGNVNTLKIQAHIEKAIAGAGNTATVFLFNLNRETREALTTPGLTMNIFTRTDDGEYMPAFFGGLTGVYTERIGTEIRTRLVGFSAMSNLYELPVQASYEKGIEVSKIVTEIAQKIPGITVDPAHINIEGVTGESGFKQIGSVPGVLDSLSKQFGFSWSIQDGVFVALKDGTGEDTAIRLTSESGLIKVSPRFTGITQVQVGVDITSKYVDGIRPGQIVSIESKIHPEKLNGEYVVHTLDCDLCPKTSEWNMHIAFFYREGANDEVARG